MSTIRSLSTLAFALGTAAAPAVLGDLPKPPVVNLPHPELPTVPELPPVNVEVPKIPEIKIKPEPIQFSITVTDLKAPRAIATPGLPVQLNENGIAVSINIPVAIPTVAVTLPMVQARQTAPSIDLAEVVKQADVPREKAPLPTISVKPISVSLPVLSASIPKFADAIPKLPRRNIKLPQVPSQTVDLPALSSVLSILGELVTPPAAQPAARDVIIDLPGVSSVISVLGDFKASVLPRQPLLNPMAKVEIASTTIDLAAVNTVTAVLNKLADSVEPRDAMLPEVAVPSVIVDLPIVSSAISVLGSVAYADLPIKAPRALGNIPLGNIISTSVALGVDVPAFTATVPIPVVPVLPWADIDLPLTTLVQVTSISRPFDLPIETKVPEVPTADVKDIVTEIKGIKGKVDDIKVAVENAAGKLKTPEVPTVPM